MVYSRTISNEEYTFGISGRLYKSNVLLYDHQTESLWSQLLSKAISGPMVKTTLAKLPSSRVKWKTWRKKYPQALVLSADTGYSRDYNIDPYEGYYRLAGIMFPVGKVRKDLSAKERVLGIAIGDKAKAYSLKTITATPGTIEDRIGKDTVRIIVSDEHEVVAVTGQQGQPLAHMFSYWFAWQAFHPDTAVFHKK